MDTAEWSQKVNLGLVESIERLQPQILIQAAAERRRSARPQKDHGALNCPRCDSTNTKFCYYNNYSLSQPRYFCKTCRRYWTAGGTLRNVPVGGGSRKNKKSSSSCFYTNNPSSSSSSSSSSTANAAKTSSSPTNPRPSHDPIHLAYKLCHGAGHDLNRTLGVCSSLLEAGPGQFVPEPLFGAGFGFRELIMGPASSMKMHPILSGVDGGDARLDHLFPFEALKHVSMINIDSDKAALLQGQHGDPTFFWNGVMGNGAAAANGGSW